MAGDQLQQQQDNDHHQRMRQRAKRAERRGATDFRLQAGTALLGGRTDMAALHRQGKAQQRQKHRHTDAGGGGLAAN